MTQEQAKSELMQIYMSLSEEKKKALDVLMAQADGEYGRFIPVGKGICNDEQADGDLISRQAVDELSRRLVHTTRDKADYLCNFWEELRKLHGVAIPSAEPRYYPPCEDCHKKMDEIRKAYDKIQSAEPKTGQCENCDTCSKNHCGDALCFGNNYCNWQPKQADGEYILIGQMYYQS